MAILAKSLQGLTTEDRAGEQISGKTILSGASRPCWPYSEKYECRMYTAPKNKKDPFRDRRSLKYTTNRGVIFEKQEIKTGDFFVGTKPPNAHKLTTVTRVILREFLATAMLPYWF